NNATTQNFSFVPTLAGTYTFTFTVTDDDGGVGVSTAVVIASSGITGGSMSNVSIGTPINENGIASLTGNITNSGTDTLTLVVDWADGTAPSIFTFPANVTAFAA